jgi:hypothetical protein
MNQCPLLICSTGLTVRAVRMWIADSYPNERIMHEVIQTEHGAAHFWSLDHRRTTQQIIASLSERGILAEERKMEGLMAIYVPPQNVARGRGARWN